MMYCKVVDLGIPDFKSRKYVHLDPPVVLFYPFLGVGSPTKTDHRKKGTLILTSLLEDLVTHADS